MAPLYHKPKSEHGSKATQQRMRVRQSRCMESADVVPGARHLIRATVKSR